MGKNQIRLLKFAMKYPEWHSYGTDRSTREAVNSLSSLGLIIVNEYRQFRLALDEEYCKELFSFDKIGVNENGLAPKE